MPEVGQFSDAVDTRRVKGPACSVLGKSVRPAAGQSRSGRRSDDGQMILPRWRHNLECPADQVLPRLSGEFEPRPSPRFKTTSSPDDNQMSLAPPKIWPHGT